MRSGPRRRFELVDRRRFLVERAREQRVLHVGCADEGLTLARVGTGSLLHEELAGVAKELVGVDLSQPSLDQLERIVPGRYHCTDVEELDCLDLPEFDVVIASEILEHVHSAGRFLTALGRVLTRWGAVGFLTTPNAYSWRAFGRVVLSGHEEIHPDHVAIYSPSTLGRALEAAGITMVELRMHRWADRPEGARARLVRAVDRLVLTALPLLAPGLIATVEPRGRGLRPE